MIIDSHQHFWRLSRGDYHWLTPELDKLYRDFLPVDIEPYLQKWNIDKTILVQAAPTLEETLFLLDIAQKMILLQVCVVGSIWKQTMQPSKLMYWHSIPSLYLFAL